MAKYFRSFTTSRIHSLFWYLQHDSISCKQKCELTKIARRKRERPVRGQHDSFFDAIDAIVGDKPNNASPHSIDVDLLDKTSNESSTEPENHKEEKSTLQDTRKKKKGTASSEYLNLKKDYYRTKTDLLEKCVQLREEKLKLLQKKIEIDERKVKALETFVEKK